MVRCWGGYVHSTRPLFQSPSSPVHGEPPGHSLQRAFASQPTVSSVPDKLQRRIKALWSLQDTKQCHPSSLNCLLVQVSGFSPFSMHNYAKTSYPSLTPLLPLGSCWAVSVSDAVASAYAILRPSAAPPLSTSTSCCAAPPQTPPVPATGGPPGGPSAT